MPFDLTDAAAVSHFVAAVAQKFGGIDIYVTNAETRLPKGFLPRPRGVAARPRTELSQQRIFCARSDPAPAQEALGPHHHANIHRTPSAISAKSQPVRRMNPQPVPSIDENSNLAETPSTETFLSVDNAHAIESFSDLVPDHFQPVKLRIPHMLNI